jgi:replicative DNA helicase
MSPTTKKEWSPGLDTGFEDLNYMTSGFQDGDLIILAARPSMGKCVKWDNWIVDPATGERVTIKEAVERKQATVIRIADDGTVGASPVSHWVDSGVQPCWRVTTKTGRFVEVTGITHFLP